MSATLVGDPKIKYEYDKILIFAGDAIYEFSPEEFLDAIDECLLMRIKKLKLLKITKMTELIKKAEQYEKELETAEDRTEIYRINSKAKVIDRIRYAVKLMDMEEKQIRIEILDRMERTK